MPSIPATTAPSSPTQSPVTAEAAGSRLIPRYLCLPLSAEVPPYGDEGHTGRPYAGYYATTYEARRGRKHDTHDSLDAQHVLMPILGAARASSLSSGQQGAPAPLVDDLDRLLQCVKGGPSVTLFRRSRDWAGLHQFYGLVTLKYSTNLSTDQVELKRGRPKTTSVVSEVHAYYPPK